MQGNGEKKWESLEAESRKTSALISQLLSAAQELSERQQKLAQLNLDILEAKNNVTRRTEKLQKYELMVERALSQQLEGQALLQDAAQLQE